MEAAIEGASPVYRGMKPSAQLPILLALSLLLLQGIGKPVQLVVALAHVLQPGVDLLYLVPAVFHLLLLLLVLAFELAAQPVLVRFVELVAAQGALGLRGVL